MILGFARRPLRNRSRTVPSPRSKILDNHIGILSQLEKEFRPFVALEVQGNGSLVSIDGREVGAEIIHVGGGLWRPTSPPVGRSIFMTSAPISASVIDANDPKRPALRPKQ